MESWRHLLDVPHQQRQASDEVVNLEANAPLMLQQSSIALQRVSPLRVASPAPRAAVHGANADVSPPENGTRPNPQYELARIRNPFSTGGKSSKS